MKKIESMAALDHCFRRQENNDNYNSYNYNHDHYHDPDNDNYNSDNHNYNSNNNYWRLRSSVTWCFQNRFSGQNVAEKETSKLFTSHKCFSWQWSLCLFQLLWQSAKLSLVRVVIYWIIQTRSKVRCQPIKSISSKVSSFKFSGVPLGLLFT